MKRSQCDLIAAVLADGKPHTAAEIHQRCGFSRLNSRIAELRSRRGMNIACSYLADRGRGPDAYQYQLVPLNEPAAPSAVGERCVASGAHAAAGSLSGASVRIPLTASPPGERRGHGDSGPAHQLTLEDAA